MRAAKAWFVGIQQAGEGGGGNLGRTNLKALDSMLADECLLVDLQGTHNATSAQLQLVSNNDSIKGGGALRCRGQPVSGSGGNC